MVLPPMRLGALALGLAALLACDPTVAPTPCVLDGAFVARGDWPSFTDWTFAFEDGALVTSYTDDLSSEDWPTDLRPGPGDTFTLEQVTEGGDATITTRLTLDATCADGLELAVVSAETSFHDLTDGSTSIDTHTVTVSPAP